MELNEQETPHVVLGACMEVHRALGPGLSNHAYRQALSRELGDRELEYRRDVAYSADFRGTPIEDAVVAEFLVEEIIALSLITRPHLDETERHRMRRILACSGLRTGFVVDFNVEDLRTGVSRIVVKGQPGEVPVPRGTRPL